MLRLLIVAFGLIFATQAWATSNDLRSVAGMRDHYRALIVFTPSLADARLTRQRGILAQIALEGAKRDLLLVQVDPSRVIGAHDDGKGLRRRFDVPPQAYRTFLIDKDGRVLRDTDKPLTAITILHAIDTAPVRRTELRRARPGKPIVDKR